MPLDIEDRHALVSQCKACASDPAIFLVSVAVGACCCRVRAGASSVRCWSSACRHSSARRRALYSPSRCSSALLTAVVHKGTFPGYQQQTPSAVYAKSLKRVTEAQQTGRRPLRSLAPYDASDMNHPRGPTLAYSSSSLKLVSARRFIETCLVTKFSTDPLGNKPSNACGIQTALDKNKGGSLHVVMEKLNT